MNAGEKTGPGMGGAMPGDHGGRPKGGGGGAKAAKAVLANRNAIYGLACRGQYARAPKVAGDKARKIRSKATNEPQH